MSVAHDVETSRPGAPLRGVLLGGASRRCLIVGGVLFAAANLLHPLNHSEAAYDYPTWELAHLVLFASLPLLALGLPFLYDALLRAGRRRAATAAVVLLLVSWVGAAPTAVIEAFVAPEVGHATMERLESGSYGALVGLLGTAFLAGTIVLGVLVHRGRIGFTGVGLVLIGTAVALVLPVTLGLTESRVAGAMIIASTSAYGLALGSLGLTRH
jgi:hypothetical protein